MTAGNPEFGCNHPQWRKGTVLGRLHRLGLKARLIVLLLGSLTAGLSRADVRFDVFLGYDGMLPAMGWFPVTCEAYNSGPTFMATVEIWSGMGSQGVVRRMEVELPGGTLKRFVIPMHSPSIYARNYSARLLDGRTVRAEMENIPVRNQDALPVPLSAAVGNWIPELPDIKTRGYGSNQKPMVARIQSALMPDNPIALSGLSTIYLNSERALELKPAQVQALQDWTLNGGNLMVCVKQVTHLNATPWLKRLLPCMVTGLAMNTNHTALQAWLKSGLDLRGLSLTFQRSRGYRLPPRQPGSSSPKPEPVTFDSPYAELKGDPAFESTPMEVATVTAVEGRILVGTPQDPLIVTAQRGRGQVSLLLFNPELKPFLTWANRSFFWAKAVSLPPELLESDGAYSRSYQSIDGFFGAMVDSRQVRKLPVGWLLLLLAAYLVVIGPLDRYWLKRINRQMLTWLTFPAYVALFSVLIYFIGYKLRAGETEWNEIHLVDVLQASGLNRWHGLTYGSLYSPANARYALANKNPYASFRHEFTTTEPSRSLIEQTGDGFDAQVSVPVWTSQLFASHWWRDNEPPLTVGLQRTGPTTSVQVTNRLEVDLAEVWLVQNGRIQPLGKVPAGQSRPFQVREEGQTLQSFVETHADEFSNAMNARRSPLGGNAWNQIGNFTNATIAACFIEQVPHINYLAPPGLDLTREAEGDNAILLAWTPNYAPVDPINQFNPRRQHRDTLWRLVVPVGGGRGSVIGNR